MPIAQRLVDAALRTPGLDATGDALAGAIKRAYDATGPAKRPLKDALNGTWLGHALHPAITDVPVGAWTAALALDVLGERRGAKIAVGVGLAGALAAALTGLTDWLDTYGKPRRLGVVHATLNASATLLYGASWFARDKKHSEAVALATLGYILVSLAAVYGGSISLDLQIGVNHANATEAPQDELDVAALADIPDGGMKRVDAAGYPVLLVRHGERIHAISAICAHQGGPLDQGTLSGDVVTCPWHRSRFCVRDGSIVNGPSAYPQPVLDARVQQGRVYVRSLA